NQDHSMYTAMLTAENIASGADHDVWSVNVEEEYHEAASTGSGGDAGTGRSAPVVARRQRVEPRSAACGRSRPGHAWTGLGDGVAHPCDEGLRSAVAALGVAATLARQRIPDVAVYHCLDAPEEVARPVEPQASASEFGVLACSTFGWHHDGAPIEKC